MTSHIYKNIDEILDTNFDANGVWFSQSSDYACDIERVLIDENLDEFFENLPELNDYTQIACPGILKATFLGQQGFVFKSAGRDGIAAQRNELATALHIAEIMHRFAPSPITNFDFDVDICVPEAIFCTEQRRFYSVMKLYPYPTLDEILITDPFSADAHSKHLLNVRALYEFFATHNIFWADMAPRNILVDSTNQSPRYIILDFEKTQTNVKNVNQAKKDFWRGAVISQEFASVCSQDLIDEVFGDRYRPDEWDFDDESSMPVSEMRNEIAAIVRHIPDETVTRGRYNKLDRVLVSTRAPLWLDHEDVIFPGKMCFFTDHILGPIYERKLNEIFLKAKADGKFELIARAIHTSMKLAGGSVADLICASQSSPEKFKSEVLAKSIDLIYSDRIGSQRK